MFIALMPSNSKLRFMYIFSDNIEMTLTVSIDYYLFPYERNDNYSLHPSYSTFLLQMN